MSWRSQKITFKMWYWKKGSQSNNSIKLSITCMCHSIYYYEYQWTLLLKLLMKPSFNLYNRVLSSTLTLLNEIKKTSTYAPPKMRNDLGLWTYNQKSNDQLYSMILNSFYAKLNWNGIIYVTFINK